MTTAPYSQTPEGLDRVIATIRERLDHLPGKPDQIAAFLKERNYAGRINSSHICPFARYLSDNLGPGYAIRVDDNYDHVSVREGEVRVIDGGRETSPLHIEPLLPGVTTFIRRFDNGEYPDLIDQSR